MSKHKKIRFIIHYVKPTYRLPWQFHSKNVELGNEKLPKTEYMNKQANKTYISITRSIKIEVIGSNKILVISNWEYKFVS